jgi:apolipoprotein N-acyltransferase
MSGISTIIDPAGRVVKLAPVGKKTTIIGNVAFMKVRSLYSVVGNIPWICILVMLIALSIFSMSETRREIVSNR